MELLIVLTDMDLVIQVYIFLDIIRKLDRVKVLALQKNQPHFTIRVTVLEEILIF